VSLFARRIPLLQDLFPSSGADVPGPNEVSDVVHLVHPWPGRALGLLTCNTLQVASGASVTPVLTALTAAPDEWIELIAGDVSHDSAAATNIQARIRKQSLSTFVGRWTVMDTALSTLGGFEPLFGNSAGAYGAGKVVVRLPWPLILPPDFQLIFDGQTQGVAYTITASLVLMRHKVHEGPVAI